MVGCVAYKCSNRTGTNKKQGITFHKFPKNKALLKIWLQALRRGNWQPSKHSCVCSAHFEERYIDRTSVSCVRLRENSVPTIFLQYPPTASLSNGTDLENMEQLQLENVKEEIIVKQENLEEEVIVKQEPEELPILIVEPRNTDSKYPKRLATEALTREVFLQQKSADYLVAREVNLQQRINNLPVYYFQEIDALPTASFQPKKIELKTPERLASEALMRESILQHELTKQKAISKANLQQRCNDTSAIYFQQEITGSKVLQQVNSDVILQQKFTTEKAIKDVHLLKKINGLSATCLQQRRKIKTLLQHKRRNLKRIENLKNIITELSSKN